MTGRRVPWTHARALADMRWNEFGKMRERRKKKRQARREERRWLKQEMKGENDE